MLQPSSSLRRHAQDISSLSTMSYDEEEASTSSAPTSSYSSPDSINDKTNSHLHPQFKQQEISPDLLQAEFYNSEKTPIDHVSNFRRSIVVDSMDSAKFKEVQENATGSIGMTNSPSLAALAHILQKKSDKANKESCLRNITNQSTETIKDIVEEEEGEIDAQKYQDTSNSTDNKISPSTYQTISAAQSPNLIQFDDSDSIQPAQDIQVSGRSEKPRAVDIFETPKAEQEGVFSNNANYRSMLQGIQEVNHGTPSVVPEIIKTPKMYHFFPAPLSPSESIVASVKSSPKALKSGPTIEQAPRNPVANLNKRSFKAHQHQQPPPIGKDTGFKSPAYSQRSSSLPVLSEPKKDQKKKKNGFMSFFTRKSSSSSIEPIIQTSTKEELKKQKGKRSVSEQIPQRIINQEPKSMKSSRSFQTELTNEPKVAKRSTSSNSLFNAFKRKSKVPEITEEFEGQFGFENPALSKSIPAQTHTLKSVFSSDVPLNHNSDDDDDDKIYSDFDEFHEDFNKFKIHDKKSESERKEQAVVQGETLFPKSLSRQEVESIVSLERNRSVRSRHSINSGNPRKSLTEAISNNAREGGMSVEIGRETSIPDLTKSPQSSVLKNTSSSSFHNYLGNDEFQNNDEELFNVEEFSQALEFSDIADSYNPATDPSRIEHIFSDEDDDQDVSKLIEFEDFIDFGGDLELHFDEYEQQSLNRQSPLLQPQSPVARRQNPLSSPPMMNKSPASRNQERYDHDSPIISPFLHQNTFSPTVSSKSPLMAPAIENPLHFGPSEDCSSFKSLKPFLPKPLNFNDTRRVAFSSKITLYDAFNEDEYDRHPDIATCNQLTPGLAQMIKNELNALKAEMPIHEDSRCFTHFF